MSIVTVVFFLMHDLKLQQMLDIMWPICKQSIVTRLQIYLYMHVEITVQKHPVFFCWLTCISMIFPGKFMIQNPLANHFCVSSILLLYPYLCVILPSLFYVWRCMQWQSVTTVLTGSRTWKILRGMINYSWCILKFVRFWIKVGVVVLYL